MKIHTHERKDGTLVVFVSSTIGTNPNESYHAAHQLRSVLRHGDIVAACPPFCEFTTNKTASTGLLAGMARLVGSSRRLK